MVGKDSLLVTLVQLIDHLPQPPSPARRGPGRSRFYPDTLFLKALVIMIVRHLHTVHERLTVLEQPTPEMRTLRALLNHDGRFPCRRTWERRLAALPTTVPARIGWLGQALVATIGPWATMGRAVAIDSTVLHAKGGVWHTRDREAGVVPHTSIDTEAPWTTSGWHGWVYGWKLHLVVTVAAVWIPLAARVTPANTADSEVAPLLLTDLPEETRFVLGDRHDASEEVRAACAARVLVTSRHGRYPHADDGVEVRRLFHTLRSLANENFNGQFKGIVDVHGPVPTRGLVNTQRFVLGAVFVYQLVLWYRHHHGLDLRVGLEPFLKAA